MSELQGSNFEVYREYLKLIARLETEDRLLGKLDLSGVVQQTLLEAHQSAAEMRTEDEVDIKKWLRRILAHNLIDEVRRLTARMRDVKRERSLEKAMEESSARIEKWLASEEPSPSERLTRDEQLSRLAKSLAQVPEDQRLAIELHHLRGMSLDDVAARLDRTKGAVASLIFRGLQTIRKLLES